jgi:ArsR family metal-binding transcriptional regulator
MALTGIQIFKLLPKTNCGECGVPTCLAFAMNLAAGKAELDACPYVSDEGPGAAGRGIGASHPCGCLWFRRHRGEDRR